MSKFIPFKNWIGLMAGEDISPAMRLLEDIRFKIKDDMPIEDFSAMCRAAYQKQRTIGIESCILGKYQMTLEDFKAKGKAIFTDDVYEHVFKEIDDYELKCQFLFAGFGPHCAPSIFTLTEPGKTDFFDRTGYWAIGSGKHAAISHLASYPYQRTDSLGLCIYRVAAAKFAAETARDIGKDTYVTITVRGQASAMEVSPSTIDEIRQGYESLPRIPSGLEKRIDIEAELAVAGLKRDKALLQADGIGFETAPLATKEAKRLLAEKDKRAKTIDAKTASETQGPKLKKRPSKRLASQKSAGQP